jgi:hypothetical protein
VYNIDGALGGAVGSASPAKGGLCPSTTSSTIIGPSLLCPIEAATYAYIHCPAAGCSTTTSAGAVESNMTIETHYIVWQSGNAYASSGSTTQGYAMMETVNSPPVPIAVQDVLQVCALTNTTTNILTSGTGDCSLKANTNGSDEVGVCSSSGSCSRTCVNGTWTLESNDTNCN